MLTFEEPDGSTFGDDDAGFKNYMLKDYMSGLSLTKEYGVSVWFKKNNWPGTFQAFLRLSNEPV